jgi:hypothetical protein
MLLGGGARVGSSLTGLSHLLGGAEADTDGGEKREAVRHGAAVPAYALSTDQKCTLLHSAG